MTNINLYFTVISIFKQNQHPSTNVYLHLWTKGQQLFLTFWYRLVWFPSVFKQYCVYEKKNSLFYRGLFHLWTTANITCPSTCNHYAMFYVKPDH